LDVYADTVVKSLPGNYFLLQCSPKACAYIIESICCKLDSKLANTDDLRIVNARSKAHADPLDYFYGDYWCIFEDRDHNYFLEFDIGRFATNFKAHEISSDDYYALKNDKSLYDKVRRNLE